MKIIKTANNNQIIISKSEWQAIGKTAGWIKTADGEIKSSYDLLKALKSNGWKIDWQKKESTKRFGKVWVKIEFLIDDVYSTTIFVFVNNTSVNTTDLDQFYKDTQRTLSWGEFNTKKFIKVEDVEILAQEVAQNGSKYIQQKRLDTNDFMWNGKNGKEALLEWRNDVTNTIKTIFQGHKDYVDDNRKYDPYFKDEGMDTSFILGNVLNNYGMTPRGWSKEEAKQKVMAILNSLVKEGFIEKYNDGGRYKWNLKV